MGVILFPFGSRQPGVPCKFHKISDSQWIYVLHIIIQIAYRSHIYLYSSHHPHPNSPFRLPKFWFCIIHIHVKPRRPGWAALKPWSQVCRPPWSSSDLDQGDPAIGRWDKWCVWVSPKCVFFNFNGIYVRSTPRPVTADKWFSLNLPFQNEHKEIAPKISARRCLKKNGNLPSKPWYRIQNSRQGLHFQDLSSISVAFQHWERRAQTTDNTFMCYPEKVRAKRLHRSKD